MSSAATPNGGTGAQAERAAARALRWDEAAADFSPRSAARSETTDAAASASGDRGLFGRLSSAAADRMAELAAARNADRIAGLLRRPEELAFALDLITRVGGIEDPAAAGREFDRLSRRMPRSFAAPWRAAALLGGGFAPVLPRTVVPVARRLLRHLVSHLVLDASPARLTAALARVEGSQISVVPLGAEVVGPAGAERRLAGIRALLDRDDLDAVEIPIPVLLPSRSPWAFERSVDRLVTQLGDLVDGSAARAGAPVPVLRIERALDLDLAVAALAAVYDRDARHALEPRLVIATELPGLPRAIARLTEWSRLRAEQGRARLALTLDTIAQASERRIAVSRSVGRRADRNDSADRTDLDEAVGLALESVGLERLTVHGSRSIDLATALVVAEELDATERLHLSVPLGFDALHAAVSADIDRVTTRAPVADPDEFTAAIAHVVQLITHSATTSELSLTHPDDVAATSRPAADPLLAPVFDPANADDRDRARVIAERSSTSALGVTTIAAAEISSATTIDDTIARGIAAVSRLDDPGAALRGSSARAELLRRLPEALRDARDSVVEVLLAETGMLLDDAAAELEHAIRALTQQRRAADEFVQATRTAPTALDADPIPPRVLVVEPSASAPLSSLLRAATAAWALGGSIVVVPPVVARRSVAVLAEVLWRAGVPTATWQLAAVEQPALRESLLRHPRVDAIASWAQDASATAALTPQGRTTDVPRVGGSPVPGVMVVTASADLERAAADAARSAFALAGQHSRGIGSVILVGAAGESERFRTTLADAATALTPGWPSDLDATLGPLHERAGGDIAAALIDLGEGQRWLREPAPLDFSRRSWTAGIREHDSTERFSPTRAAAPVLDVYTVPTLDEAIELQRSVTGGADAAVAALHARDPDEVRHWLESVEAADLVVNAASVDTLPPASVLWTAAAVGVNPLASDDAGLIVALCRWRSRPAAEGRSLSMSGIDERLVPLIAAAQPGLSYPEFDRVRRAARSDEVTPRARDGWRFADAAAGHTGVGVAAARLRSTSALIRLAEGAAPVDLVRVLLAAAAAEARVAVSSAVPLPAPLATVLRDPRSPVVVDSLTVESDAEFERRLMVTEVGEADAGSTEAEPGSSLDDTRIGRIRLIGANPAANQAANSPLATPAGGVISAHPVVESGRVEVAVFQRAQSVVFAPGTTEQFIAEVFDLGDVESDGA